MAEVTAALIKKVREITGAGMSDVKKALVAAEGDEQKAIEELRIKGAKDIGKREGRTASNGLVAARLTGTPKVLLELNCETDFVAKSATFQTLADDLAAHVAASDIQDVPTLLESTFGGGTVRKALDEANIALGEKIEIRRFSRISGEHVESYLHRTAKDLPPTIGVLVELSGDAPEVGRGIAQHIAAFPVRYLRREDVPADVVDSERRLAEQIAREEGKPEAALSKIVDGRLNGFYKDFVVLEQPYVRDAKQTVRKVLDAAGVELTSFVRFKVGQA